MEKNAKLILKERRYESTLKKHEKHLREERHYREDQFFTINEERERARKSTLDKDQQLDDNGYSRFKKDTKDVEARYKTSKEIEQQKAHETYVSLHKAMEASEKKERDWVEEFNYSAMEAQNQVQNIQKNMKKKHDKHLQVIDKVKTKLQNQFEK